MFSKKFAAIATLSYLLLSFSQIAHSAQQGADGNLPVQFINFRPLGGNWSTNRAQQIIQTHLTRRLDQLTQLPEAMRSSIHIQAVGIYVARELERGAPNGTLAYRLTFRISTQVTQGFFQRVKHEFASILIGDDGALKDAGEFYFAINRLLREIPETLAQANLSQANLDPDTSCIDALTAPISVGGKVWSLESPVFRGF